MVGDPGTGKSQILRYAAKLTPRSVLTSGIGSTNAGLTVSAIRDGGQWSLEAGALVLADGGICCIDEFSSIRETDRVAIHEAMEQQCISVAKAGVVTRLQSRCSILATANPKGKYDPEQPLTVNIGVASPLLSRFDLVFVLLDSKNPDWDAIVSSYILEGKDPMKESSSVETTLWNFDKLQAFFVFCKHVNPTMAQDSSLVLSKYYQKQRGSDGVNMARATVRLLQSCIRLAQGHARLMNHDEVTICDAINAIVLLELSFDSNPSFLSGINPLHTTFPADPLEEYKIQAEVILTGLGLSQLWDKEKRRLQGQLTVIKEKPRPMEQSPRPLTKSQRPLEQIQRLKCGDEKEQEAVVMVADCSRLSQKRKRSDEEEEDSSLFSFGATQDKEYTSSTPINTSRSDVKAKLKAFKAPLEMSQLSSQVRFRFKKINTSDEIK
jgi:DNA helicase MCM9